MAHSQEIALTSQTKIPYSSLADDKEIQTSLSSSYTVTSFPESSTPNRYFGKTILFCYYKGKPLCTLGPHWWLFLITWIFLELIGVGLYFFMDYHGLHTPKIIALLLTIWEGFIYMLTALKNPGIVMSSLPNLDDPQNLNRRPFCSKCNIYRDPTTIHCTDCDVCIKGLDHHCPWTGKCIGEGNLKVFYTFIVSTMAYLAILALLTMNIQTFRNL